MRRVNVSVDRLEGGHGLKDALEVSGGNKDELAGGMSQNGGVNGTANHHAGGGGGGMASVLDDTEPAGGYESGGGKRGGGRSRVFLRIHKFAFEWELNLHFSLCIASIIIPFAVSGALPLIVLPLALWGFYNAMFLMGAKRASAVFPSFDRLKRNFVSSIEEFLPPRLLPVLSLSFLSVVVAVAVTAARLRGPPLCLSSCGECLSRWAAARPVTLSTAAAALTGAGGGVPSAASAAVGAAIAALSDGEFYSDDAATPAAVAADRLGGSGAAGGYGNGFGLNSGGERDGGEGFVGGGSFGGRGYACGYANGRELLAFYTVSQSAILIYLAVMVGLLTCLAWKVSEEELAQRQGAESWLKGEDPVAFDLRERMIYEVGRPGSAVRPETSAAWLAFGVVAACTFTLIGWRKWGDLPATVTAAVAVGVSAATILVSVLLLHVGFYGRLVALYRGNLCRVQYLSRLLREGSGEVECGGVSMARAWWSVRSFVLSEDLSLDYDIGGLGVSATFFIVLTSFVVAVVQICREGLKAILSPPGSYCAYASVYLTVCLIRIFGLATETYGEQQAHVALLRERVARVDALLAAWATAPPPPPLLTLPASLPASVLLPAGRLGGPPAAGGPAAGAGAGTAVSGAAAAAAGTAGGVVAATGRKGSTAGAPKGIAGKAAAAGKAAVAGKVAAAAGKTAANGGMSAPPSQDRLMVPPSRPERDRSPLSAAAAAAGGGGGECCSASSSLKGGSSGRSSPTVVSPARGMELGSSKAAAAAAAAAACLAVGANSGAGSTAKCGACSCCGADTGVAAKSSSSASAGKSSGVAAKSSSSGGAGSCCCRAGNGVGGHGGCGGIGGGSGHCRASPTAAGHAHVGHAHPHGDLEKLNLLALRDLLERMVRQIQTADPYPCVLGVPVKPALFATSKMYVFVCFAVISTKVMYDLVTALL